MDEAKALDNQVLYNEARGDRGGIGAGQDNSIQNTAATNRLTVQKEQTQLATDTARQIADLRSQGEFEKANQLLSISQKYLSELMDLYQWAKETNVSIDEFNLQVAQWEENFKLSLVGAELDAEAFNLNVANAMIDQENNLFNARLNQENSLFDARLNASKLQNDEALARLNAQLNAANVTGAFGNGTPTYAAQQDAITNQLKERQMLSDIGVALIKAGIQPSAEILAAMGMGGAAADNTAIGINNATVSSVLGQLGYSDATSALRAMGIGNAGLAGISAAGMTPEQYLAAALGVTDDTGLGLQALDTASLNGGVSSGVNGVENILSQLGGSVGTQTPVNTIDAQQYLDLANQWNASAGTPTYSNVVNNQPYSGISDQLNTAVNDYAQQISNSFNTPNYTNANNYNTSWDTYPNEQSYVAAYNTPTNQSAATDASITAMLGYTPEEILRAAGIGNGGFAGISAVGLTPAQIVASAFGL